MVVDWFREWVPRKDTIPPLMKSNPGMLGYRDRHRLTKATLVGGLNFGDRVLWCVRGFHSILLRVV